MQVNYFFATNLYQLPHPISYPLADGRTSVAHRVCEHPRTLPTGKGRVGFKANVNG